jgi:hypothetical protein
MTAEAASAIKVRCDMIDLLFWMTNYSVYSPFAELH